MAGVAGQTSARLRQAVLDLLIDGPLVCKPLRGGCGRDIHLLHSPDEDAADGWSYTDLIARIIAIAAGRTGAA